LQNVAYIRLKNLQIGYNFSNSLLSSVGVKKAKIYLSAVNLWTYSPLFKHTNDFDVANIYGTDQEAKKVISEGGRSLIISNGGHTYSYPSLKSVSVGLSITF
jgi:hypothetical protein